MTIATDHGSIDLVSVDESHAIFERRSQELLGMSRQDFLATLDRGDFVGREDEKPIRDLLALLPFALAE